MRPILAEIQRAFPGMFEVVSAPDEFGTGFKGVLRLPGAAAVTLEVLSNFEDVPSEALVRSTIAPRFRRISLQRFLADKIQCIAERAEARDLADIAAVLQRLPRLEAEARRIVQNQDALIMVERLTAWNEATIRDDLAPYRDVDPAEALGARNLLLEWLRTEGPA